jgi:hypothetical protein
MARDAQVRLDSNLVERGLIISQIEDSISRIYYLLLAVLTDSYVASSSSYWLQFGMSSVGIVLPSMLVVGSSTIPNDDYAIEPPSAVVSHWESFSTDTAVGSQMRRAHLRGRHVVNMWFQ